jgi:hypothetical protein
MGCRHQLPGPARFILPSLLCLFQKAEVSLSPFLRENASAEQRLERTMLTSDVLKYSPFYWDGVIHKASLPNTRPEWRGAKDSEMQTGRAIPRPL